MSEEYAPFGASRVWADDDGVLPLRNVHPDPCEHTRFGIQIIHGYVKETLDLTRVQVHRDDVVAAGHYKHIRHEFRGDRCTGTVLLVHAGIGETGDHSGDAACRSALTGVYEDEEFHEMIVDVRTAGLNDEDVRVTHGLGDFGVGLPVGKLFDSAWREWDVQSE
jgi:hypothetical protein